MTLIELMVAMAIGLILSLAVYGVLAASEGRKRTTTSVNDINQAGNYALQVIDSLIRSAGSGFVQGAGASSSNGKAAAFGCAVYAAKSGLQVLPRTATLPAPFTSVNTGTIGLFRLAPILIAPGQTTPGDSRKTSDVLVVMSGAAGDASVPAMSRSAPGSDVLNLYNTLGFSGDDIVLVAGQPGTSGVAGPAPCMIQQVVSGFAGGSASTLSLGGTYYNASVDTVSLSSFSDSAAAMNLGNVTQGNPPHFMLIGVGDHSTLYQYDLLQTSSTPLQAVADGVFELHARYGVSTGTDGKVDSWIDPASSSSYSLSALMAGTTVASALLKKIKVVRVGLILRTSLAEKKAVAPESLTLFTDLDSSLRYTRTLSSSERVYRFRTVEMTIPLRNNMLIDE